MFDAWCREEWKICFIFQKNKTWHEGRRQTWLFPASGNMRACHVLFFILHFYVTTSVAKVWVCAAGCVAGCVAGCASGCAAGCAAGCHAGCVVVCVVCVLQWVSCFFLHFQSRTSVAKVSSSVARWSCAARCVCAFTRGYGVRAHECEYMRTRVWIHVNTCR